MARVAGPLLAVLLLLPASGGLAACRRFTKAGADREVYDILARRRARLPLLVGSLDVEAAERVAEAARQRTRFRLGLADALALAAAASREYRSAREDVYLAALDLTLARNEFRPILGGSAGGDVALDRDDVSLSGRTGASLGQAFQTGGGLVVALAQDFLRNFSTASPLRLAQSILSVDLRLPLGRGGGLVAREALTQAERNSFYAMREYARFQQTFTVDIASRFYRVVQDRDRAANEDATYASLKELLDRQVALGAQGAGRIPDFEVDQAQQDLLRADQRRLSAATAYEASLDAFKLELGIPVDVEVELVDDDLETLRAEGPQPEPVDETTAPMLALERRLDVKNVRDRYTDALRRVRVAMDGLGPQVDLLVSGNLRTPDRSPLALDKVDPDVLLSIDLDLPLERTAERNAYRSALIGASRAKRNVEAAEDRVVLEVRSALRSLALARKSYEIQAVGLKLAERRVDSTALLLEAGQALTRDRLDAENALVQARNDLTGALVNHAIARLELMRDVGTLLVDADARWTEPASAASAASGTPAAPDASSSQAATLPPPEGGLPPEPR